jgi:hypothetical protein
VELEADKQQQVAAKADLEAVAALVVKVEVPWEPLVAKVVDNKDQQKQNRRVRRKKVSIARKLSKSQVVQVVAAGQVEQVALVVEVAQILEAEQVDQAVEAAQDSRKFP